MLQLLRNDFFDQGVKDILAIANDPIIEVDLDTGIVFYDFISVQSFGASTLYRLAHDTTKTFVGIRGETSDFSAIPVPDMTLRAIGGFTIFDDVLDPKQIEIVYDAQRCGGKGNWVEGVLPKEKIEMPTHVMLLHEMRHAVHLVDAAFTWDQAQEEQFAIEGENEFRKQRGLPLRGGHGGGCKEPVGFWGAYKEAGGSDSGGGGNCFVATAAFGSALDPNVEFLRRFRDDVIRETRAGDIFWETFFERYERLSPTVVEMLRSDEELRGLVRWSLVQPIVHYLEVVQSFPDAPLDDVPEPWASWLTTQRDTLARWLGEIELPDDFTGMEPDAVVAELALLLRYVLRTPETTG